eukprot:GHVT01077778.1.p1 GENE.GHVT01077778.1~~GHVT01077778.1.p1  ORF type:complete len:288 (+),score=24.25 GHVT01077778.1:981-1844(+)
MVAPPPAATTTGSASRAFDLGRIIRVPRRRLLDPKEIDAARRPIGFRGNHRHRKPLNDPVYPTSRCPRSLVPRPRGWWFRVNARGLLGQCMALLDGGRHGLRESARFNNAGQAARWFLQPWCHRACRYTCVKEPDRCLCAWRLRGVHEHIVNVDGFLASYKGPINRQNPKFPKYTPEATPLAPINRQKSEPARWDASLGRFVLLQREGVHEAFHRPSYEMATKRGHVPFAPECGSGLECPEVEFHHLDRQDATNCEVDSDWERDDNEEEQVFSNASSRVCRKPAADI